MKKHLAINSEERRYLRDLAQKYLEYAHLPVMEERRKLWYAHNTLQGPQPVIVMEMDTFQDDMLPALKCESSAAREIEFNLVKAITNHELIDDDKVISPYYTVYWRIDIRPFNLDIGRDYAKDSHGRALGYSQHHPISDLSNELYLMQPSIYSVDRGATLEWKAFVEDTIGDILPVRIKNASMWWHAGLTSKLVDLMGLETMMYEMIDHPDEMHKLMQFITDDVLAFARWQEAEELLTLNNGNDYAGAGSYGFTDELPTAESKATGKVRLKDLWLNTNSQETVGISPAMFEEFFCPYYTQLANEFGLVYYGCCEPVHSIWDNCISKLPGLRKVSVSPWCDEEFMGSALRDTGVIYSRKPSPNFIGVGIFDKDAFRAHIIKTLKAAKGCQLEFIFRDIYTVTGDRSKPGKAVRLVRELIDRLW